jgi:quercetin dioxygenase-like cupin family protein
MGIVELKALPELEISPGIKARAVTADSITVLHVDIEEGALLPEHSHHNEQVVNVTEGELELVVEGVSHILKAGKVMVLPPDIIHSGKAITKCKVVDVFYPVREDFRGSSFVGYDKK